MPDFWQFPTVSMGLGPLSAIYQARFNRYLAARGLADTANSRVWAFVGDGEMDEPESLAGLSLAAREGLDNLIFVVNCNLQRLDGPVRGNGKIIQELESVFRGAGWHVIKVIWSREWDALLERDTEGVLLNKMTETLDGDYQTLSVSDGAYVREHFFGPDPRLQAMVADKTDAELAALRRGGHDYRKLYAAYRYATEHTGAPVVILAKTVKGWTLGPGIEGRNITHQAKKLTTDELKVFRDRLELPIPDDQLADAPYYHPGKDSPEIQYLLERRRALGGTLPRRTVPSEPMPAPSEEVYSDVLAGAAQPASTTMAFGRLLRNLVRDPQVGRRVVPIIPDEARTFGMDPLFKELGIYNPLGQQYEAVDRQLLLSYREATDGQILEEGITEAGSMASFTAAGTSYAVHGEPIIPFYVFYSMFGLQRTGDQAWAFGDARGRGFMMGATAGRTTLTGEGLQHDDGQSHLYALAIPNLQSYDPAFAYELGVIVRDGIRRMWQNGEDVFYYITLYNENWTQPPMPEGVAKGILRGLYRFRQGEGDGRRVQLLGSGSILHQALRAADILAERFGVAADVWSVTSYQQLRADGLRVRPSQPTPSGRRAVGPVCHPPAGRQARAGHRRHRLRQGRARPHRPLDHPPVPRPGHGRIRPVGHPRGAADLLRGEPRAHRLRGHGRPVADRRGELSMSWSRRRAALGIDPGQADPAAVEPMPEPATAPMARPSAPGATAAPTAAQAPPRSAAEGPPPKSAAQRAREAGAQPGPTNTQPESKAAAVPDKEVVKKE